MAFLPYSINDQDPDKQNQPVTTGGQSSVINSGSPDSSITPKERDTASGSFTNLQSYLDANRDQAGEMGSKVVARIDSKANEATSSLGNLQNQFNQKVNDNKVTVNQDMVNQAISNPTDFVKNQDNVSGWNRVRDASYQGPKSFTDLGDDYVKAQTAFNQANQFTQNAQTEQGRMALSKDIFDRPNYTNGAQKLDQLLLQNSPEAKQNLSSAANRYKDLSSMFNTAESDGQTLANQAEAETLQSRNTVRNAVGREDDLNTAQDESLGAIGNLRRDLNQRASDFTSDNQTLYNNAQSQLSGNGRELSQDVLDLLGLTEGSKLYDTNLASYQQNFNPEAVNASSVAKADDLARYNALLQLSGGSGTLVPEAVGTAQGVQFDQARLRAEIAAKEAQSSNQNSELSRNQSELAQLLQDMGGGDAQLVDLNMIINGGANQARVNNYNAQISNYQNLLNQLRPSEVVRKK